MLLKTKFKPYLQALGIFVGIIAFLFASVVIFGRITGTLRLEPILSGSMSPSLTVGSDAVLMSEPSYDLAVGQVVAFTPPKISNDGNATIIHKVIQIVSKNGNNISIRTKGIANPVADPWVSKVPVGKVWVAKYDLPYLGYIALAFHSPIMYIFVFAVLAICILAVYIITRLQEQERQADDTFDGFITPKLSVQSLQLSSNLQLSHQPQTYFNNQSQLVLGNHLVLSNTLNKNNDNTLNNDLALSSIKD